MSHLKSRWLKLDTYFDYCNYKLVKDTVQQNAMGKFNAFKFMIESFTFFLNGCVLIFLRLRHQYSFIVLQYDYFNSLV